MVQAQSETGHRTFVFQYTAASGVDERLSDSRKINFSWNERAREITTGDFVVLVRAGAPQPGVSSSLGWAGITGWGRATAGPVEIKDGRTPRAVPLAIKVYSDNSVIARENYWYDHRLARTGAVFGQQGSNFLVEPEAADALFERISVHFAGSISATLPHSGTKRDLVTERLDRVGCGTNLQTARALNTARLIATNSRDRNRRVNWPLLLIGLVYVGVRLRDDAKTGALLKIAAEIATAEGNRRVDDYLAELTGNNLTLDKLNWRTVAPVIELSPSAGKALDQAGTVAATRPISGECVLAALLNDAVHYGDEGYERLFGLDRQAFVERLVIEGRARARPADMQAFERWLDIDTPPPPAQGTDRPAGETARTETDAVAIPAAPAALVAATLNDTVKHGRDFLKVTHEARAFARLIASSSFEPPLAIGVFGHWGSGKTFFMERIADELETLAPSDKPPATGESNGAVRRIVPIRFNAWHYMETNVWASLVDVIFRELDGWLRRQTADRPPDDSIDMLFESLSTAQAERLQAIESVAERIRARETARREVQKAAASETARWRDVASVLAKQNRGTFDTAIDALGLGSLASEAEKLRAAIGAVDAAASDGALLWHALRTQIGDWRKLALLIAGVILLPLGAAWLGRAITGEPLVPALTGFVATGTAWVTWLAHRGQTAVAAMRTLKLAFDEAEHKRAQSRQETLAQHHDRVDEAERLLEQAEAAAADAQRRLHEGSATGRISTFIRSRAESDIYSRHLGIIATVRRDFEQLTALMAESRDQARVEQKALDQQRRDTQTRIDALRARYKLAPKDIASQGQEPDAATESALKPVKEALDRLEQLNKVGNPLGHPIGRIVLFIDDLDRCPPAKVYAVLQAVHLFLSFPLFVVVVGVDTRWMEASLERQLKGLVDGRNGATPQDYLEKIFQIPYWTRRMDTTASRGFVTGVLGRLPTADATATATPAVSGREEAANPIASDEVGGEVKLDDTKPDGATPGAEAMDPKEDDTEDELINDGNDRGDQRDTISTRFGPVVLSEAERAMIRDLAPEAGRSPRQLMRFVNVYGLIKSVTREDGSPEIDPAADPLRFQALLTQLAIATGSPRAARVYFQILERHAVAGEEAFLNELFSKFSSDELPLPERLATVEVLRRYLQTVGLAVSMTDAFQFHISTDNSALRFQAFRALSETSSITRRYTFAAPDAVPVVSAEPTA